MARIDAAIAERAQRQLGLLTIGDLNEFDIHRTRRRSLLEGGVIERIGPGLYALIGMPRDLRRLTLAACLSAGPSAVASHRSAAWLWRMPGAKACDPEITVTRNRQRLAIPAIVHRPRELPDRDLDGAGPIPITTRIRTLIDCASLWRRSRLERTIDHLCRDGLVDRYELIARAQELHKPGRPGVGQLLRVLGAGAGKGGRPESWLEHEFLRVLRRYGLSLPATQVVVPLPDGSARLDFAYVNKRLALEVDGHATHSTRRERQADAERNAQLTLAGWTMQHFTYEDIVERPGYVVRTTAALLRRT